ncbi:hypothetical protein V8C34DRAFT_308542 [Trichoderma compactum]
MLGNRDRNNSPNQLRIAQAIFTPSPTASITSSLHQSYLFNPQTIIKMAKFQNTKTDKSTTTLGCTVMAKPQTNKLDEYHTTLGCTVMAKPQVQKLDEYHTTLGCTIM